MEPICGGSSESDGERSTFSCLDDFGPGNGLAGICSGSTKGRLGLIGGSCDLNGAGSRTSLSARVESRSSLLPGSPPLGSIGILSGAGGRLNGS